MTWLPAIPALGVQAYVERLLDDLNEVGLQAFVQ